MELGLLHDFFGNFSTRGERYYFGVEGSTRGENMYVRWECVLNMGTRWLWVVEGSHEVRICTWRWLWMVEEAHEVRICTQGEKCVCEVRICVWGDFEGWRGQLYIGGPKSPCTHARWLWGVEGTTLQRLLKWGDFSVQYRCYFKWWPSCKWWKFLEFDFI